MLEPLGVGIPVSVPVSDSVQDVTLAARVASREPGLEVEPLERGSGRLPPAPPAAVVAAARARAGPRADRPSPTTPRRARA
jgi:hypothetical protein